LVKKIGKYEIVEHIGHGAMGSVEKVRSTDGRILALKTLSPLLAQDGDYVKRFKREAEIAIQLSHPNVVRVYELGEDDNGLPYIIMEYIEGKTLDEIMHDRGLLTIGDTAITLADVADETVKSSIVYKRGSTKTSGPQANTFTTEETIRLGRQVSGVLQSAYDLNLLHRDIKPQNIMIDKRGNAKLLDFGIAKALDGVNSRLSLTGQAIGTPTYMSPEQFAGTSDIDIRADLYSLGCTMYHMLTGKPPFCGSSLTALANMHLNTFPPPAHKVNENCPLNLSQVVDRLLAKNPRDRHKTPAELIEDLNRVERGEVPLKLYKAKKSKKYNPLITWFYVMVTAILLIGGFIGYNVYRKGGAQIIISEAMSDAQQLAVKYNFDGAKDKLDTVIVEYSVDHPELVKNAETLRKKIIEQHGKWISGEAERQRREKQANLVQAEAERQQQIADAEAAHNPLRESARLGRHAPPGKQTVGGMCAGGKVDPYKQGATALGNQVKEPSMAVSVGNFVYGDTKLMSAFSSMLRDELRSALSATGKFKVISRERLDDVMKEYRLQQMDIMEPGTKVKPVKIKGVDGIVRGKYYYRYPTVTAFVELVGFDGCETKSVKIVLQAKDISAELIPANLKKSKKNIVDIRDRVKKVPHDFKISLSTKGLRRNYQKGEKVSFRVEAEKDCHIAVFCHQSDGSTVLLFPNSWNWDTFIKAKKNVDIPGKVKKDFEIEVGPPYGSDVVQVIACSRASDLHKKMQQLVQTQSSAIYRTITRGLFSKAVSSSIPVLSSDSQSGAKPEWSENHLVISTYE
jgi:serine/threonine protein kinase